MTSNIIKKLNVPLNRAEGDLEINIELNDNIITEAWSSGTMYRGFEEMMTGRGVLDGLVITPRICGICGLSHLTAAVGALDVLTNVVLPDNAVRLCNIALIAELIQSDMRQAFLMYMVDFIKEESYRDNSFFKEAFNRYNPLKGSTALEIIKETKKLIKIIAIIGGQWPHTSFMVPGGVTSIPETHKLLQCKIIVGNFIKWYEKIVLGCSIEEWNSITTLKELYEWLEKRKREKKESKKNKQNENNRKKESEVEFFIKICMESGIDKIGKGFDNFISFGSLLMPQFTEIKSIGKRFLSSGFARVTEFDFSRKIEVQSFDHFKVTEDISHSWYKQTLYDGSQPVNKLMTQTASDKINLNDFSTQSLHPFNGVTKPYASGSSGNGYSWIKAPRYDGMPAETGPLAEMIIDKIPLFRDMVEKNGADAMVRELARITRAAKLLPVMLLWLDELTADRKAPFYTSIKDIPDGEGAGMIEAARGALGHWVSIKNGRINNYQVITPTAWNGSPRDINNVRGPWEQALIGTPVKNPDNPIEAGHIIRSFDPCMVCSVH